MSDSSGLDRRIRTLESVSGRLSGSWTSVTFTTIWHNIGGPNQATQFCRDGSGFIHLRGAFAATVPPTASETIFTLPAGKRPPASIIFPVMTNSGIGRIDVANDGRVLWITGAYGFISVDGLTFDTRA